MKQLLIVLSGLLYNGVIAQNEFIGSWRLHCAIEKTDASSAKQCDICPYKFSTEDNSVSLVSPDVEFQSKVITINTENGPKTVYYKWDEAKRILEFNYQEQDYRFKALSVAVNNVILLKQDNGMTVMLERR